MELKELLLSPEELTPLMERANKIYELPGFTVTLKDTCEWAGKLAALTAEAQLAKVLREIVDEFDDIDMKFSDRSIRRDMWFVTINSLRSLLAEAEKR